MDAISSSAGDEFFLRAVNLGYIVETTVVQYYSGSQSYWNR